MKKYFRTARLLGVSIALLFFLGCGPQKFHFKLDELEAPHATFSKREKFKQDLFENTIMKNLGVELTSETESKWQAALWAMELSLHRSDSAFNSLKRAFGTFNRRSLAFQRALLEAVYCLYPNEFIHEIYDVAQNTPSPKLFAMAIHYLNRLNPPIQPEFQNLLLQRFPNWQAQPILFMLHENLKSSTQPRPPLIDLFSHPFEQGKTLIFCLQRSDRNYPGLTIIRKPDGQFLRTQDGDIFHVSHLARAISNLPGYITNGNTPQGIFSIQGIDVSNNQFIGQTPNLQLTMPFEISAQKYFHNEKLNDTTWSEKLYRSLLPESWRSYLPIWEAYYAGQAGRTEIIAHGTTIDPEFYAGQPYYPNTPSLGCITAKELWSGENGRCLISDQLRFINAFRLAGSKKGYFVVVELDDKQQPVVLEEVIMDILKAEGVRELGN
ncbi:MAG: hypothetical protein ONB11_04280 [candidate division KSB1 bacterium]|nr:hypothetical protein [candidate division KSB1 bacterium]